MHAVYWLYAFKGALSPSNIAREIVKITLSALTIILIVRGLKEEGALFMILTSFVLGQSDLKEFHIVNLKVIFRP